MIHKEIDFNIGITNSSVLIPLSRYRNNGIINNLPEPKPVCQVSVAEVIEEEQKKKSVLKRLQEPVPVPEGAKPVPGCVLCGDRERF